MDQLILEMIVVPTVGFAAVPVGLVCLWLPSDYCFFILHFSRAEA